METETMTRTSLETVQEGYKCFAEGNIAGLVELLDENVIWKDPGTIGDFYKSTRRGRQRSWNSFRISRQTSPSPASI